MSKWVLPDRKGIEISPLVTNSPVVVRFRGVEPGSDLARELYMQLNAQIEMFYRKAAGAHAAGITEFSAMQMSSPEMSASYTNNWGQETVHIRVAGHVLERAKRKPPPHGYLLIEVRTDNPATTAGADLVMTTQMRSPEIYKIRPGDVEPVPAFVTNGGTVYPTEKWVFAPTGGLDDAHVTTSPAVYTSRLVSFRAAPLLETAVVRLHMAGTINWNVGAANVQRSISLATFTEVEIELIISGYVASPETFSGFTPGGFPGYPNNTIGFYPDGSPVLMPPVLTNFSTMRYYFEDGPNTRSPRVWSTGPMIGNLSPPPEHPDNKYYEVSAVIVDDVVTPARPVPGTDTRQLQLTLFEPTTRIATRWFQSSTGALYQRFVVNGATIDRPQRTLPVETPRMLETFISDANAAVLGFARKTTDLYTHYNIPLSGDVVVDRVRQGVAFKPA